MCVCVCECTSSIWSGVEREKAALTYGQGSLLSIMKTPPGTSSTFNKHTAEQMNSVTLLVKQINTCAFSPLSPKLFS